MKFLLKLVMLASLLFVSSIFVNAQANSTNPADYIRLSADGQNREINLSYRINPVFDNEGNLVNSTWTGLTQWFSEPEVFAIFYDRVVTENGSSFNITSLQSKINQLCNINIGIIYSRAIHVSSGLVISDLEACLVIRDYGYFIPDPAVDVDGDGIHNDIDNCPSVANPSQEDFDLDEIGDACDPDADNDNVMDIVPDNCLFLKNTNQSDIDSDGMGDPCDPDTDGDGADDTFDNCPLAWNPGQENMDSHLDNEGDACDFDSDGDQISDNNDNCPNVSSLDQTDTDLDGDGNICDFDDDNDTVLDTVDNCPLLSNPNQEDLDEDGIGDVCDIDSDDDGFNNDVDNCPYVANPDQSDKDEDGKGDACDTVDDSEFCFPIVGKKKTTGKKFAAVICL